MNDDELPVVSRIVIEVRSDGTRTIARGAAEDPSGQVGVEVRAETPAELVRALLKLLAQAPALAATSFRTGRKNQAEIATGPRPEPSPAPPRKSLAERVRRRLGFDV